MIVIGPGQREGLLFQFSKPGNYSVMQYLVNNIPNISGGEAQPTALIRVAESSVKRIDLSTLNITPGVPRIPEVTKMDHMIDINFGITFDGKTAPFPQFQLDGEFFNISDIRHSMAANSTSVWTLKSSLAFHPFHIQ